MNVVEPGQPIIHPPMGRPSPATGPNPAAGVVHEVLSCPVGTPAAGSAQASRADGSVAARKPSRLWLWFVAAFALQLGAWVAWFLIASQHKVAEVPLATSTAR